MVKLIQNNNHSRRLFKPFDEAAADFAEGQQWWLTMFIGIQAYS